MGFPGWPLTRWTTADELDFLQGLGTHRHGQRVVDRQALLDRYAATMVTRTLWGDVDPVRVRECVQELRMKDYA